MDRQENGSGKIARKVLYQTYQRLDTSCRGADGENVAIAHGERPRSEFRLPDVADTTIRPPSGSEDAIRARHPVLPAARTTRARRGTVPPRPEAFGQDQPNFGQLGNCFAERWPSSHV